MMNLNLRALLVPLCLTASTLAFAGEPATWIGELPDPVWTGNPGTLPVGVTCPDSTVPVIHGTADEIPGGRPAQDDLDLRRAKAIAPSGWDGVTWYVAGNVTTIRGLNAAAAWCVTPTGGSDDGASYEDVIAARNLPDASHAWGPYILALLDSKCADSLTLRTVGMPEYTIDPDCTCGLPQSEPASSKGLAQVIKDAEVGGTVSGDIVYDIDYVRTRWGGVSVCPADGQMDLVLDPITGECREPTSIGETLAALVAEKAGQYDAEVFVTAMAYFARNRFTVQGDLQTRGVLRIVAPDRCMLEEFEAATGGPAPSGNVWGEVSVAGVLESADPYAKVLVTVGVGADAGPVNVGANLATGVEPMDAQLVIGGGTWLGGTVYDGRKVQVDVLGNITALATIERSALALDDPRRPGQVDIVPTVGIRVGNNRFFGQALVGPGIVVMQSSAYTEFQGRLEAGIKFRGKKK